MHTRALPWLAIVAAATLTACGERTPQVPGQQTMATGDVQKAALATYVKPGDLDEYYLFYSGGHSGQVFVAGVPSMRHIATIPVFAPYPGRSSATEKSGSEPDFTRLTPVAAKDEVPVLLRCVALKARRRRLVADRALGLRVALETLEAPAAGLLPLLGVPVHHA